ncbi:MAG: HlyD family secretion protein [Rubrivivax sp.]|jgi:membrane fusion protein|nr:HlyD family secretion protein [Rubrivivax sp.]
MFRKQAQKAAPQFLTPEPPRSGSLARSPARAEPVVDIDDGTALFRREAMEAQRVQQYGEIVLLPGAWSRGVALAALLLVVAAALLISLGSYTRRSTVQGHLVPSEGLIRVTTNFSGVVIEKAITDGQMVRRGDTLFVVSDDRAAPNATGFQQAIAEQIESRRASLQEELRRNERAEAQETAQLRRRAESLTSERAQLARQSETQQSLVQGAQEAFTRDQSLAQQGFLTRDALLTRENALAEAKTRLQSFRREALALERELGSTQRDLEGVLTRYANQRSEIERSISRTFQEFTEVEARRRVVVAAPADGRLTLVQANIGQSVDPQRPMAHLVPSSSELVARLYVPSRGAGFVRPGTEVQLRYDAYPYQKFGQHRGVVSAVSAAAIGLSDIGPGLGAPPVLAAPGGEALFAVTVKLPSQTIGQGAKPLPLQAGMQLEADLMHETRRLYEWILEPLFAARERMGGGS